MPLGHRFGREKKAAHAGDFLCEKRSASLAQRLGAPNPRRSHFRPTHMLFLLRLVATLPLPLLHLIGAPLGWVVYLLSPRYRKMIARNLEIAGLGTWRLRAEVVSETGKGALEIPAIW